MTSPENQKCLDSQCHRDSQDHFSARLRSPDQAALPDGVPAERMQVYEELFFNNVLGLLSNGFPVVCSLLPEIRWTALVRSFYREHRCQTPYFPRLAEEFVGWLQAGYRPEAHDPVFLVELAHYEWLEVELDLSVEVLPPGPAAIPARLLDHCLHWSPLAMPVAYTWPVEQIGPDHCPVDAPALPTCLLVWRDRSDQVRFQRLSPLSFHLACALCDGDPATPVGLQLNVLALTLGQAVDERWRNAAETLLQQWVAQDVLLLTSL